ncbi:TonB-dependent siderophore receptor [Bordetella trematum]|uniref:TonB-dependent siderophore receptor n=1 Tax=Bordetella trematum TaxID=123899 RepID=UPI00398A1A73
MSAAPAQAAANHAEQGAAQDYRIAAGPLAPALRALAGQANVLLTFTEAQTGGKQTRGLAGRYMPAMALQQLLAGTGLQARQLESGAYVLQTEPARSSGGDATTLAPVLVTGQKTRASDLPATLAGGQAARGTRVGLLGNQDVMLTPFSISGYTAQAVADQQATSVLSVLRNDASVRSVFPAGAMGEHFLVRGFHTQSHELAWNGVFGLVPHNRTPTEFLERVEILKGPGALLYGMSLGGAVGGVVNLVPKRAGADPLTRVTATYASDSRLGAHLDLGRRFGEDQQFGIRVNGLKSRGDSQIDGQTENRTLGSVALDYAGERVRATLDIYGMEDRLRGGSSLQTSFAGNNLPKPPDPKLNQLRGAYSNSRSKAVIAALEVDLNDDWQAFVQGGIKRQTGTGYLNNANGRDAQVSGDFIARSFNINNYFNAESAEVGLRGRLDTGPVAHTIVLNANRVEQESGAVANVKDWASNLYRPGTPVMAEQPKVYKTSQNALSSVALADTLSFAEDSLLLTLGLRQQRVEAKGYNQAGKIINSYDQRAITPAAGVVLKPWEAPLSVYANYIEGLSEGGSVTDPTAKNFGHVFRPYKSKQTEVGLKWEMGDMLSTLSYFQISRPSLIKDNASDTYGYDGRQRNRGIEWSLAGEPLRGLRVLSSLTHMDAVTTKTAGGLYDGKQAMGVPRWSANLGLEWDVPALPGLTLTGNLAYVGSQYLNNTNTNKIPHWTRTDLGLRYASKLYGRPTVWRAGVTNVFDKRYWESVYFGSSGVGMARAFRLSMQMDF